MSFGSVPSPGLTDLHLAVDRHRDDQGRYRLDHARRPRSSSVGRSVGATEDIRLEGTSHIVTDGGNDTLNPEGVCDETDETSPTGPAKVPPTADPLCDETGDETSATPDFPGSSGGFVGFVTHPFDSEGVEEPGEQAGEVSSHTSGGFVTHLFRIQGVVAGSRSSRAAEPSARPRLGR